MSIFIASDFHCKYQKVAWMDTEDGEIHLADVEHEDVGQVRKFFSQFAAGSVLGMESSGFSHWFEEMVVELGLELRVGDSRVIAAQRVRRQKNDERDVCGMLALLAAGRFPVLCRPTPEQWQQRRLLRHRCQLVKMRTQMINAVRALAYNYNLQIKRGALSQRAVKNIKQLPMSGSMQAQRDELLDLIEQINGVVARKDREIAELAESNEAARRLMSIPGVGPATALAAVLWIGPISRFRTARKLTAYVGLDTCEHSTNNAHKARRYGHISKQGNTMLRWMLVQCALSATRHNEQMKRRYRRLLYRKDWRVARTAVARRLLVCMYVLLRDGIDYPEFVRRSPLGMPEEPNSHK